MASDFGEPIQVWIPVNVVNDLEKHRGTPLNAKIRIEKGIFPLVYGMEGFDQLPQHDVYFSDPKLIHVLATANGEKRWVLVVETKEDIHEMTSRYGVDVKLDMLYSVSLYLQSLLFLFGPIRILPFLFVDNESLILNRWMFYHRNPWADWFFQDDTLKILLDESIHALIGSKEKDYHLLKEHVRREVKPFNAAGLRTMRINTKHQDNLSILARVLSKLIYLSPTYDHSMIVGLLTSFIEGILKIKTEHSHMLSIKLCNLFQDQNLFKPMKRVYKTRSDFFHSGNYKTLNDVFEYTSIYFLLFAIQKIMNHSILTGIDEESFNFPSNP
jgi:hypothetical protein